ncbi:MAG: right-handed parallel beta-helix repeat-containing protein [Candidatus Thermoplasmatota archaeon]|nr:right-handed parallel beta-helix repeat-containing protein [Candidatus Thermoplasmatota archaeon]
MTEREHISLLIVTMLVLTVFLTAIQAGAEGDPGSCPPPTRIRTPHAPISIVSDTDLATQAASESWPGTGSGSDPYIISALEINGSCYKYGIYVKDTTVHFVISDCVIMDTNDLLAYPSGSGIWFNNVQHATVLDCEIIGNLKYGLYLYDSRDISLTDTISQNGPDAWGMYLLSSSGVVINGCTVQGNEQGIHLEDTTGSMRNCTIRDHPYHGIEFYSTSGLKIEDNLIEDNGEMGVYIRGNSVDNEFHRNVFKNCSFGINGKKEVFTTNHIPVDNTVNGLPIYQFKDHIGTGEEITSGGGQLILGNVSNVVISGVNISRASEAIILGYCHNVTVRSSNLSLNERGIEIWYGDNITVKDSVFLDCDRLGIYIESIEDCVFRGNHIVNVEYGIAGDGPTRILAENNTISYCWFGIYLTGYGVVIKNNIITGSDMHGILMEMGFDSTVQGNIVYGQGYSVSAGKGISAYSTEDCIFMDNRLIGTKKGIELYETKRASISNNTIDSSLEEGILLVDPTNCTLTGNLIYRSVGPAINVQEDSDPPGDNLFWYNSFLYNNGTTSMYTSGKFQAFDMTGLDDWYSSTEGKGNHWSDLTAPDVDDDGIVDTPYLLSGGAMDERPLVEQPLLLVTPPTDVSAQGGRETVNISWGLPLFTRSGQISGYRVYRSVNGSDPSLLQELPGDAGHLLDMNVDNSILYDYSVMAFNRYGDGEFSPTVQAAPDSSPPTIYIISPTEGSFWNVSSLEASWESADNTGVAGHRIRLDAGNWTEVGTETTTLISNLTEGEHLLDVEAYDALDNSVMATSRFHIDLTPPVIEIIYPVSGSFISTPSLEAIWQSDLESEGRWQIDDGEWNVPSGVNRTLLENLTPGWHVLEVEVMDEAGNMGRDRIGFLFDPYAPVIVIIEPAEGEEFKGRPINASWTADGTGSSIVGYSIKLDSGPWKDVGLATSMILMGLEKGGHTFGVSAKDEVGNTNTVFVNFTVTADIPNPPPPGKGLVMGTVNDKDGDPIRNVKVTSDTGEETKTDSSGMFSIELPAGSRTLTFTRDGYEIRDITIIVEENKTREMEPLVMEDSPSDREDDEKWMYPCLCGLVAIIILISIIVALVVVIVSRRRYRSMPEE